LGRVPWFYRNKELGVIRIAVEANSKAVDNITKGNGPRTDPCGTPKCSLQCFDSEPSWSTNCVLWGKIQASEEPYHRCQHSRGVTRRDTILGSRERDDTRF
jgi:hypothetical protein